MAEAPRDQNHVTVMLLESSTSAGTVITAKGDQTTGRLLVDSASGSGTVTSVSVVSANGFTGSVATATTTPAITLTTSITGILKGNGTAISAASAGTDYTDLAFKTISVSGQSDVVADTAADTLTLVAGSNVTITTDATTDTITIAASGAATPTAITVANEATDATCFIGFFTAATGDLGPKTNVNLTFDSSTGVLTAGQTIVGSISGNAGTASAVAVGGITGLGTNVATALAVNVGSAGAFVVNGGALGTPSSGTLTNATGLPVGGITGLGTNVATALAVNVGSAGAFVTFNGALGTPSSGTVTNLTGTASININGTVGATTPTTGVFTTATVNTGLLPDANDGAYIGQAGTAFSDVFLASGGVINWDSGNATITHSAGLLTSNVDIAVPDEAYGAGWNGSLEVPTKNAVYDKIQTLGSPSTSTLAFSTMFETAGRFTSTVSGGGAFNTFGTSGLVQAAGATANHYAQVTLAVGSNATNTYLYNAGAKFSCMLRLDTKGTTGSMFYGLGTVTVAGTGHTFTDAHIGFKVLISGSVATIYATCADGTETATSLGTWTTNDTVWLHLEVVSTSSVNFYWRKTNGSWSSATNITTNIPVTTNNILQFSNANDNTASNTRIDIAAASYSQ